MIWADHLQCPRYTTFHQSPLQNKAGRVQGRKSPLKTVHKRASKSSVTKSAEFSELNKQKQIDLILDKISKSGYDSLTKEEKEFLFRAGK